MDWYQVKLAAIEATGLSRDALHILFGIGGHLLAAIVLRRALASRLPWLCVLVAEALNELWDLNYEDWPDRPMWPESVQDLWVTMLVPTVVMIVARYFPGLLVRKAADAPVGPAKGEQDDKDEEPKL
jgi:hypothetical protein